MESDVTMQDERDKEMCAIALDEAFGLCGNNTVIFEQIATIMGIRKADLAAVTPLDSKYRTVLNGGKHDDKWVIARAWDLVVNDKAGIMDAFNQAWGETEVEDVGLNQSLPVPGGISPHDDPDDIDNFPE